MKAIVIGGGIGGVSAAIALRQAGIDAAVFERAPAAGEVGAGISIWGNAVRALRSLGAEGAVIAAAGVIGVAELRTDRGRPLMRVDIGRLDRALGTPSLMLHRAELLDALMARLPAGVVRFGAQCAGVEHGPAGATARFADGSAEHADVLIGADGLNSAVRASLHGRQPPRYAGYTCWRAVAAISPDLAARTRMCEYWGRGSRFGVAPIGGGHGAARVYWYATINAPPGGGDGDVRAELDAIFGCWCDPIPAVLAATPASAIIRSDIFDRPPARTWGRGRATLLGDAAHPTTPNIGQGACMAIEDAVVLARRLGAPGADPEAALRAYERDRFRPTSAVTRASWRLGRMGQWSNPAACALRDTLCELTPTRFLEAGYRRTAGRAV